VQTDRRGPGIRACPYPLETPRPKRRTCATGRATRAGSVGLLRCLAAEGAALRSVRRASGSARSPAPSRERGPPPHR
jgi:hypothetical protein